MYTEGVILPLFCFFKASVVVNILYFDNFIKIGPAGGDFGEKMIGNVLGALMRGRIVWKGHVLAAI